MRVAWPVFPGGILKRVLGAAATPSEVRISSMRFGAAHSVRTQMQLIRRGVDE